MSCARHDEDLSALVDNELDPADAQILNEHLRHCDRCHARAGHLLSVQQGLAELARVDLPADVTLRLSRITAGLQDAQPAPSKIGSSRRMVLAQWGLVATLAAVSVGALILAWSQTRHNRVGGAPQETRLWRAMVVDHLQYAPKANPLQVSSAEPAQVERWFRGRLPFELQVPTVPGARLLGGRHCTVSGHQVALLFYELLGERISMFVMKADDTRSALAELDVASTHGPQVRCAPRWRGSTLCVREMTGLGYVLVSETSSDRLTRLLGSGLRPPNPKRP